MTGEQVRWGMENLALDQKKLDALGFSGVMRPVSTSCQDHMGSTWARVHTWDGSKWGGMSDWYQADEAILKPMVKAAADKYASEKKLTRRTPARSSPIDRLEAANRLSPARWSHDAVPCARGPVRSAGSVRVVGRGRSTAPPRPSSFDLDLQRNAQESADQHDQRKDRHALERGIDGDGTDDVRGHEEL